MDCFNYKNSKEKIIDFKDNDIVVISIEMVSGYDNMVKLNCKDKNKDDVFILQRIQNGNTENWYFKEDFNSDSAINFSIDFDLYKKKNIINNKKDTGNSGTGGGR
jgi:hypothetical protein